MKINKHFYYIIFLILILSSCKELKKEYEYKQIIVKAKTIDLKEGSTRYNIAFTNGESDAFTFGTYSNYNIGDTIYFERQ